MRKQGDDLKHRKPYCKWRTNGFLMIGELTGREGHLVTIIGETKSSYRVFAIKEIGIPIFCRPGDIILIEKSAVRIDHAEKIMKTEIVSTAENLESPPPISYLYPPPASALAEAEDKVNQWHVRMSPEFIATELSVFEMLFHWLDKAKVSPAAMLAYGVFPSVSRYQSGILAPEFHKKIVDQGRVVRRRERRRGGYVVLGEPFGTVEKVEQNPYVEVWRSLGSRMTCLPESGWSPGRTVMVLLEAPVRR